MTDTSIRPVLGGQKALVFSIVGAELAITWLNDRAPRYVEPLVRNSVAIRGSLGKCWFRGR